MEVVECCEVGVELCSGGGGVVRGFSAEVVMECCVVMVECCVEVVVECCVVVVKAVETVSKIFTGRRERERKRERGRMMG